MDKQDMLRRMRAGKFIDNNGQVLRTINILRHKYERLQDVKYALEISESDYLDSINFLSEAGYIHLRDVGSKQTATIADSDYDQLEAKLTEKGIRLLGGEIHDQMVKV